MSRRDSPLVAWSAALALALPVARAQTISDYSRAQRLWLEASMSQAAARSAGLGAPAPAVAASAPVPLPPASPSHLAMSALPVPGPAIRVSGVFASGAMSLAEVVVDATPYLLRAGEGVPGTGWHVRSIAVDRVVLGRSARTAGAGVEDALKFFDLPLLH